MTIPTQIGPYSTIPQYEWGEVAEGSGHTAFIYRQGQYSPPTYLWIDGTSYDITTALDSTSKVIRTLIIPGQDYVYVAYSDIPSSPDNWVKVSWFNFSGELVGTKTWTHETKNIVLLDAIVLSDSRIFLSWYQDLGGAEVDLPVYFSYGDKDGWADIAAETITPCSPVQNRGSITQLDSSTIWEFIVADSKGIIHAIKLGISGGIISVTTTYEPLIDSGDGDLYPQSEIPYIKAITVGSYMLLAYQNDTDYTFDLDPFTKGAYIAIAKVNADATFSEVAIIEHWAERISPFGFGYNSDFGWWVATATINDVETEFDQLRLFNQNGSMRLYGESASTQGTSPLQILNSSGWFVAKMVDTYLHFYSLSKAVGPLPIHFRI